MVKFVWGSCTLVDNELPQWHDLVLRYLVYMFLFWLLWMSKDGNDWERKMRYRMESRMRKQALVLLIAEMLLSGLSLVRTLSVV